MRYLALAIANYFIDKANVENNPADHLRLQKLVYIAHGWHLAIHGTPLIEEAVEAWKYGPVIPSLYRQFRRYGNGPITENGAVIRRGAPSVPGVKYGDTEVRSLLDRVWEAYRHYSGVQLSNLTHETDTPWHEAWNRPGGQRNVKIKDGIIDSHFRGIALSDD